MNISETNYSSGFLNQLVSIVGSKAVITEEADTEQYLIDQRRAYKGRTIAVVRPANTNEVSKITKLCAKSSTPIVPQGGNTGLCGGATPDDTGDSLVVNLSRMNNIRKIDALNYTITVDAGVILENIQKAADKADRLFPLSLGAEGSCQIGGNLSTNAGGTGVLRYGAMRELVFGLECVMPDGEVWDGMTALRKDNTGYDLKHLFMGAEGTLGIITGAVLKLFPKPKDIQTAFVAIRDPDAALELLARARTNSDDRVTAFEWISRRGIDFTIKNIPNIRDPLATKYSEYLLIELSSGHPDNDLRTTLEELLNIAMVDGLVHDAALAENKGQAQDFWRLREAIPEAQMLEGATIKHDISVPISNVPLFLSRAKKAVEKEIPEIVICAFGHIGDGNIHYNLTAPKHIESKSFFDHTEIINRVVHDIAVGLGGSISAEHGIGVSKRRELYHYKHPIALEIMRSVKLAIDPNGIMNPGKVL
ncbi:MAG: hydroxyacid dehydrogenase [Rhodospirillaceae bacterium]|nr:hydroxyacid dehydrogenase [Rhodospirillaceae bacterium]